MPHPPRLLLWTDAPGPYVEAIGGAGLAGRVAVEALARKDRPSAALRWSPSVGQLGGLGKLGPGFRQAANLVTASAPYASSGVLPSRPEWGRLAL